MERRWQYIRGEISVSWCCVCCICGIVVLMVPGSASTRQRLLLRHGRQIGWCAWLIAMINYTCWTKKNISIKYRWLANWKEFEPELEFWQKWCKKQWTYYVLFCHRVDSMIQFDWMSIDLGLNRIHSLVRFCANAVADFLSSAKKWNNSLNMLNAKIFHQIKSSTKKSNLIFFPFVNWICNKVSFLFVQILLRSNSIK